MINHIGFYCGAYLEGNFWLYVAFLWPLPLSDESAIRKLWWCICVSRPSRAALGATPDVAMCVYIYIYIYVSWIYIYIYIHDTYIYIYIYTHIATSGVAPKAALLGRETHIHHHNFLIADSSDKGSGQRKAT